MNEIERLKQELERLREALKQITAYDGLDADEWWFSIARRALEAETN